MILLALKLSSILVTPYSTVEMHKASDVKSLLSLSYLEKVYALLQQVREKVLNIVSLFLLYLTHINHASFIGIHFVFLSKKNLQYQNLSGSVFAR